MLRVLDAIPPAASLLDIGAGHGLFASLAHARASRRVVGIDPDMRKVRSLPGIEFVIGFDDAIAGSFDAISIIDVMYKIPFDEWDALLSRCRMRLAGGGILVIKEQDPTARFKNSWNRLQERLASSAGLTLGEAFSYETPADFTRRLERLGFTSVRARRIDFGYPHPHVLYVARTASTPSPAS